MDASTRNEAVGILKALGSKEVANKVNDVKAINPVEQLRLTIFNFFSYRLETIKKDEVLKDLVEKTLMAKIDGGELTVPQLIALSRGLRADSTMAVDSLLSILKPVPNTTNPLMDRNREEDNKIDQFNDLDAEGTQAIETLTKVIRDIREAEKRAREEEKAEMQVVDAEFIETESTEE